MTEPVALRLFERLMVDVSKFRILERSYTSEGFVEGTRYVIKATPDSERTATVMIADYRADDEATAFIAASTVVKHLGDPTSGFASMSEDEIAEMWESEDWL